MGHNSDFDNNPRRRFHGTGKIGIGFVLILVGFILIIRNTGLLPSYFDDIIFSWQALLIAIGFVMTLGNDNKGPGLIVMAVGGFFILPEIFDIPFRAYRLFWPAIFIIVGVIVLTNSKWLRQSHDRDGTTSSSDFIDVVNIFGGGERTINSDNFSGGKITAIFGGGELDLTRAKLAPGESHLEITAIFGGVSLIVPPQWNVVIEVTPILGGFSDTRKFSSGIAVDPSRTLVIRGAVVFGGGEVKGY